MAANTLRIGAYNLLCPFYAKRHRQAEGIDDKDQDSWPTRWPALARILGLCPWDILCLTEIGAGTEVYLTQFGTAQPKPLAMVKFKAPGRMDSVAVMYAVHRFELRGQAAFEFKGAVAGLVDLWDKYLCITVRAIALHQWHPCDVRYSGHLDGILHFAKNHASGGFDCIVLAGDFNEDLRKKSPLTPAAREVLRNFVTANRGDHPELPTSSTSHSKDTVQLDFVWVRGAHVEYCDICRHAILSSHRACSETGRWPSDHGLETVLATLIGPGYLFDQRAKLITNLYARLQFWYPHCPAFHSYATHASRYTGCPGTFRTTLCDSTFEHAIGSNSDNVWGYELTNEQFEVFPNEAELLEHTRYACPVFRSTSTMHVSGSHSSSDTLPLPSRFLTQD